MGARRIPRRVGMLSSDFTQCQYYCLRLVPPVGRRLELGLVRNMLASLFICPNVMQLMLPLHLLMHLCFGISFSNSMCREIVPHYAVTTRHRVIFSHPHSCSYPYSFLHLRTPTPKTFNSCFMFNYLLVGLVIIIIWLLELKFLLEQTRSKSPSPHLSATSPLSYSNTQQNIATQQTIATY